MKQIVYRAAILAVIYFTINLFTLSDYGVNWDEPVHFMRGQTFLRYMLEGKKDYADLPEIAGSKDYVL
ncbi:MAG: hypothetical protein Q8Q65_03045, partial [bacterium]|nr:hypothetical protein [bacterium]